MKSTLKIKPKVTRPVSPPPPPPRSLSEAGRKRGSKKGSFKYRAILLGGLICFSAVAIGWSLGKLTPMNQRQEHLNQQVSELTDSIARLEFSIHPAETQKVESDYSRALQSLFDETSGFPQWQQGIQQRAGLLDLQVKAFLGEMQVQNLSVGEVRVLPATLEIVPLGNEKSDSVFQRLIQFNDYLLDPGKKVELKSLQVIAGTNSIERVEQTINIWFEREES